jgi:ABC-type multidrug transport system ATPase subunit
MLNYFIIIQPRSNIFKMFDSLMLLTSGQLAYFGPAKTCSSYFRDLGFPIPADYNVADYLSRKHTTFVDGLLLFTDLIIYSRPYNEATR